MNKIYEFLDQSVYCFASYSNFIWTSKQGIIHWWKCESTSLV